MLTDRKCFIFVALLMMSAVPLSAAEVEYETKTNVPYRPDLADEYAQERCVLDIYFPTNKPDFATIVFFHGGGLKAGNKSLPAQLKRKGYCVVAPNYRLHPKVKAPVYIEDAAAAVAWVFKNIEDFGGDPSKIFISGASAGGYLTSMVGLDKQLLAAHEIDANDIAGLIPLTGHAITHFTVRAERNIQGTQPIIDEYAPLYHVRADAPSMLLITGDRELEMLGRYEENAYLMRMMKVAGHKQTRILELGGYGHGISEAAYPLLLKEVKRVLAANKD
ncbi:Lipase 2 [Roseimaritima multifibrata]|uniref:Lipase 2 n=1 Tax=Roseimaritima multifibrata TaxID=1930274 RepID=A0A517MC07_9BACT|nr:alpha/beta hydrolase fold domain-containing protein [Roseimaritima multifibrata]QDS92413.1 Lipase 2 [Roseimaritima multifibrata]